ncbi:hypothetical protein [Mycobacterium spongiae]|uniref:Uncharacterized protein n=1 Tax=Mycobacterium spongiae TaxID=886343 RepID=A0A975JYY4_9MYCO|nr:hypothetical protein [Mycobacterium spongiae]QUR68282.1 hypothetical protein F6B93_15400 [Mycobacterium spongiae]
MSPRESLLDTFPGRLFIDHLRSARVLPAAFVGDMGAEHLIEGADSVVGSYLYSDACLEVADLDVDDPELQEFNAAGLAALAKLSTFDSPQIHQGKIGELREPVIVNRNPLSALPGGAFWTSTPISDGKDSWTVCGENLSREDPRWEVYFDIDSVRVARVDSARDWIELIESHPIIAGSCKYPDWPAIAESWDAVHLSAAGLLLAHPTISTTRFVASDVCGEAHSQAGPYASVADWSAVSTAWLHRPPNAKLRSAERDR